MMSIEELLKANLLQSPPNFEMAENHNKAQIIHKGIIEESETCPCCNLSIQTIKYPLSSNINVFCEYKKTDKFFRLLKLYFVLLSIFFIIAGFYNLIQNYKGDLCIKSQTCEKNLNNYLSLVNRFNPESYEKDSILEILYIIATILQLVFIRCIYSQINDFGDNDYYYESTIKNCSLKYSGLHIYQGKMKYWINFKKIKLLIVFRNRRNPSRRQQQVKYHLLLKSIRIVRIDGKNRINLASQLSDIHLWTKINRWIELYEFISKKKVDEKRKQAQSIRNGLIIKHFGFSLYNQIKQNQYNLKLDEISLFIYSLKLPSYLQAEIIIQIALQYKYQINKDHVIKLLEIQEDSKWMKFIKSGIVTLTHKTEKYERKQLYIYENKVIQGCRACLKFLSIQDQPQKLVILNRNFNKQLKHKIKKFYLGNSQVFSDESNHQLRLRLMSQALKLEQLNFDYDEMKTKAGIEMDNNNLCENIYWDISISLDFHKDKINLNHLQSLLQIYAFYNQEVGYCQGMNYIAGYLYLTYEDEEIAYKAFHRMMNLQFKELYINDFSKLKTQLFIFEKLLFLFLPELSSHLRYQKINITFYVATWLITLYSNVFQYSQRSALVNVIWDLFLAEEWKGFYKATIFIFSLIQLDILNLELDQIYDYLGQLIKSQIFSISTEKELIQYIQIFDNSIKEDVSIKKTILSRFRITNRMLKSLESQYHSLRLQLDYKLNNQQRDDLEVIQNYK